MLFTLKRTRRALALLALLLVVIALLPNIAARTSFRNEVARRFVPGWRGNVTTSGATLGWLQSVEFRGLKLRSTGERTTVDVSRLHTSEPFWRFIVSNGSLGNIQLERPVVDILLPLEPSSGPPPKLPPATVDVNIHDLALHFKDSKAPQSLANIEDVNLRLRLRRTKANEQEIQLEPGDVLNHIPMTPLMGQAGLMYIAPILADLAWTKGDFSLAFDACRINLAKPEEVELRGRLSIHHLSTGAKNPILQEVGKFVQSLFPNQPLKTIRLADESIVHFEAVDGGIRHQGLAFGLPEISDKLVLRTHGWVGFDQRLDLILEVPLDLFASRFGGPTGGDGGNILKVPIGGTLNEPKLNFKPSGSLNRELFDQMLKRVGQQEPAAQQTLEMLRPIGKRVVEKGLPKVGRFARDMIEKNLKPRSKDQPER